jgi:hypothetical protein
LIANSTKSNIAPTIPKDQDHTFKRARYIVYSTLIIKAE